MWLIIDYGGTSLNFTLTLLIATLKFISGFGLVLSVLGAGIFVLKNQSDKFKGKENKKQLKIYQITMLIIPIALLIYKGPVKLVQTYRAGGETDNIFDKLLFLFGICSLLITLYIIPLFKEEFLSASEKTLGNKIKDKAKKGVRGLKKGWFKMWKSYGKVQLEDQKTMQDHLEFWKQRFAVLSLIILGIGMFIFTPISVILIVIWIRVYALDKKSLFDYERYMLIGATISTLVIAILIPFSFSGTQFYQSIKSTYFWVDFGYFLGLLVGTVVYLGKFLQSSSISWLIETVKEKTSGEEEDEKVEEQENVEENDEGVEQEKGKDEG